MQIDKAAVAAVLRRQGYYDRAQQAECALSRKVDTDRDAGLLRRLEVDLTDLTSLLRGAVAAVPAPAR